MASHHQRQEAGYKADDEMSTGGHAQMMRPSETQQQHDQSASITSQATTFLQQTGEQMKNMAQGAAEAVKNTLGMNTDNSSSPNASAGSAGNIPGSGPTASAGNNPMGAGPTASAGNHPGGASFGSSGNNRRSGPTASAGNNPRGACPTGSDGNHPDGNTLGDISIASGGNLLSSNQGGSAPSHARS